MGKGRLNAEFLDRTLEFSDRCLAVAERLARAGKFARFIEQLAASGCSVGANIAEANEAMSLKDFRKCLSIAIKELAETRFWLTLVVRRKWLPESRLRPLMDELLEIRKILGTILARTRLAPRAEKERVRSRAS
jgi:four helix bundle protein